jgi:hypothetical protein
VNVVHGHQNLFAGHGGWLLDTQSAVKTNNDFHLITWLVIQPTQSPQHDRP